MLAKLGKKNYKKRTMQKKIQVPVTELEFLSLGGVAPVPFAEALVEHLVGTAVIIVDTGDAASQPVSQFGTRRSVAALQEDGLIDLLPPPLLNKVLDKGFSDLFHLGIAEVDAKDITKQVVVGIVGDLLTGTILIFRRDTDLAAVLVRQHVVLIRTVGAEHLVLELDLRLLADFLVPVGIDMKIVHDLDVGLLLDIDIDKQVVGLAGRHHIVDDALAALGRELIERDDRVMRGALAADLDVAQRLQVVDHGVEGHGIEPGEEAVLPADGLQGSPFPLVPKFLIHHRGEVRLADLNAIAVAHAVDNEVHDGSEAVLSINVLEKELEAVVLTVHQAH